MLYISTRGMAPSISSKRAIIKGIADDGGLYVPENFPFIGSDPFRGLTDSSYAAKAEAILHLFLSDYSREVLLDACVRAYGKNFDSPAIAPIKFIDDRTAVLELWHGPTLAFKDMALQLMPGLLSSALRLEGEDQRILILVATSGDTGKAALEGFAWHEGIWIFVFYPHEGVSEIQRLQMVTQRGDNVGVCGVRGNFDDVQNGVKRIFSDSLIKLRLEKSGIKLSSANSINWGRLAPQIVYYFVGYEQMALSQKIRRGEQINICVPTGNFGNILAAYYAVRCGLPVGKLICASNLNNVLTDFIRTGIYDRRRQLYRTESPSMDILISSNLERLLFELTSRDSSSIRDWMGRLSHDGWYRIDGDTLASLQSIFYGDFADRHETSQAIREAYSRYGYLMDPHSAVGFSVLQKYRKETGDKRPALLVSTASPFKFNKAVLESLGMETSDKDEFRLLEELSALTGQPVPERLAELRKLPQIHGRVCERDEMGDVLFDFLKFSL